MTRAGFLDYPTRDLDDCIGYIRKARSFANTRVTTRDDFAEFIGQSVKGGGFGKLVGAMTSYGLVETGGGKITTTDLCEQILYGEPAEQRTGMEKAVRNVRLWGDIYERFRGEPAGDELRNFLREEAHVEVAESERIASEVGRLLRRNLKHLTTANTKLAQTRTSQVTSERGLVGTLETADYGTLNIKDEISMGLAISLLTQISKAKGWSKGGPPGSKEQGSVERKRVGKTRRPPIQARQTIRPRKARRGRAVGPRGWTQHPNRPPNR